MHVGPTFSISGYPDFRRVGPSFLNHEAWDGVIRPFDGLSSVEIAALLDDLDAAAQVYICRGALSHDPDCRRQHPSALKDLHILRVMDGADKDAFTIRVVVPPPPLHPYAFSLYPEVSRALYPTHPHVSTADPGPGWPCSAHPDTFCAYRPWGDWSPGSPLTTLFDFMALFLAKHVVWRRTRQLPDRSGYGIWLGPDQSHEPSALLKAIKATEECWCFSGRRYGECHRRRDIALANKQGFQSSAA